MSDRPILKTLAVLFLLAGGGQVIGAIGVTGADAERGPGLENDAVARSDVRPDGLIVREETSENAEEAASEELQELAAQRIELRLAAMAMKEETARMETVRAALAEERSEERAQLVALYARMPAEKAATILSALPAEDAAVFISSMPSDKGAAIISQMSDDVAVQVTEALVIRDF